MSRARVLGVVLVVCLAAGAQQPPRSDQSRTAQQPATDENNAPPRSSTPQSKTPPLGNEESSSKQTKIDLTPPPGEERTTIDAPSTGGDVQEWQRWDPHKADKNIEVGDFYFKKQNYLAAASRYREALEWKPNDALATFGLAQSLEKLGQFSEARKNYASYLKILPKGPDAVKAREGIERLKNRPDEPMTSRAH